MIAVDVNTLAYLWIPGEMTGFAEQALARDPHWVSLILWRSAFPSRATRLQAYAAAGSG